MKLPLSNYNIKSGVRGKALTELNFKYDSKTMLWKRGKTVEISCIFAYVYGYEDDFEDLLALKMLFKERIPYMNLYGMDGIVGERSKYFTGYYDDANNAIYDYDVLYDGYQYIIVYRKAGLLMYRLSEYLDKRKSETVLLEPHYVLSTFTKCYNYHGR